MHFWFIKMDTWNPIKTTTWSIQYEYRFECKFWGTHYNSPLSHILSAGNWAVWPDTLRKERNLWFIDFFSSYLWQLPHSGDTVKKRSQPWQTSGGSPTIYESPFVGDTKQQTPIVSKPTYTPWPKKLLPPLPESRLIPIHNCEHK